MIMEDKIMTDEDKMIEKLEAHRDICGLITSIGQLVDIDVQRTTGNDSNGDIVYPKDDEKRLINKIDKILPGKRRN